jgi:nucleoside-diphosphate-sugar epimerase
MDILFIGGTGTISTECAALLAKRGHRITILSRGQRPIPPGYNSIIADRHDQGAMRQALAGKRFDVVADFTTYNEDDARQMLELFGGRCAHYLFVSTVVVYSKPAHVLPITETAAIGNAFSPYGQHKAAAEALFMSQHRQHGFPVTIIRPSHTYSQQWLPNPVSSAGYTLARRIEEKKPIFVHDDGQGLWTLTHARDFAVGFAGLCGLRDAIGEAVQITADAVLTWKQIIEEIRLALGVDSIDIEYIPTDFICHVDPDMIAKFKGDKSSPGVFDCAKLKSLVPDFQCRIPYRDGAREAVAWFKADPARQCSNPSVDATFDRIINAWRKAR